MLSNTSVHSVSSDNTKVVLTARALKLFQQHHLGHELLQKNVEQSFVLTVPTWLSQSEVSKKKVLTLVSWLC